MMRAAVAGVVAMIASTAIAADALPLAGIYGNASGCAMAMKGPDSAPFDPDWVVITATGVQGHEFECLPATVGDGKVTLSCKGAGTEGVSQVTATFDEDRDAGLLHWTDPVGAMTFKRCDRAQ